MKNEELTLVTTSDGAIYAVDDCLAVYERVNAVWSPDETLCALIYPGFLPQVSYDYSSQPEDLWLIDTATGNLSYAAEWQEKQEGIINSVCFSEDGKTLYFAENLEAGGGAVG